MPFGFPRRGPPVRARKQRIAESRSEYYYAAVGTTRLRRYEANGRAVRGRDGGMMRGADARRGTMQAFGGSPVVQGSNGADGGNG